MSAGTQTVTEWRAVFEFEGERDEGGWRDHFDFATAYARRVVRDLARGGLTPDAVYLEKRTVTFGEPVRVELDEGSGDAV